MTEEKARFDRLRKDTADWIDDNMSPNVIMELIVEAIDKKLDKIKNKEGWLYRAYELDKKLIRKILKIRTCEDCKEMIIDEAGIQTESGAQCIKCALKNH